MLALLPFSEHINVLTIFFGFIFFDHVSYIFKKFSDFWYNRNMNSEMPNLAVKIFSETVCKECESSNYPELDAIGREEFWKDLGRPTS